MKIWSAIIVSVLSVGLAAADPGAGGALELLRAGNDRFSRGRALHPYANAARRALTAAGQHPFATVLACSDSRVPVEILFDRGIGDLFTIRVAGEVAGLDEIGSVEYAVDHLHTPLLVVMGHTHCGAVSASVEKDKLEGSLPQLVGRIDPAVARARSEHPGMAGEALIEEAVKDNVWQTIGDLFERSAGLRAHARSSAVQVVGAVYDIATGRVRWLGRHPAQAGLTHRE